MDYCTSIRFSTIAWFCCVFFIGTMAQQGRGDVFIIEGGGGVTGTVLNPDAPPYRIETVPGAVLTIAPNMIRETIKDDKHALREYNETVPFESDTIENHLRIADQCVEKRLPDLAKIHWNRVIELEPDHALARKKLGHIWDKDFEEWTTTEKKQARKGYIYHKGRWRTSQDIWISERESAVAKAEAQWKKDIRRLASGVKTYSVRDELTSIDDPAAVGPLIEALGKEKNPDIRVLYLRALANIGTPNAIRAVAQCYMDENVEGVRSTCLNILKHKNQEPNQMFPVIPTAGAYFSTFLINLNPDGTSRNSLETINRAAYAIGEIGDDSSLGALVGALNVKHKESVTIGSTATNAGFSPVGTGFAQGQSTRTIVRSTQCEAARDALKRLTGQNFGYDQDTWRTWMKDRRKPVPFNARRG